MQTICIFLSPSMLLDFLTMCFQQKVQPSHLAAPFPFHSSHWSRWLLSKCTKGVSTIQNRCRLAPNLLNSKIYIPFLPCHKWHLKRSTSHFSLATYFFWICQASLPLATYHPCIWQFFGPIKVYLQVYFHWPALEICNDPILLCKLTKAVLLSLYYLFSVTVQCKAFSDTWCPFLLLLHQGRQGGKWIAKSFPSAQFKGKISKFNMKIEFSSV